MDDDLARRLTIERFGTPSRFGERVGLKNDPVSPMLQEAEDKAYAWQRKKTLMAEVDRFEAENPDFEGRRRRAAEH